MAPSDRITAYKSKTIWGNRYHTNAVDFVSPMDLSTSTLQQRYEEIQNSKFTAEVLTEDHENRQTQVKYSRPSHKNARHFYTNRKQCHETFKKSGANIQKKCKELEMKTACKVYYVAEFKTLSGKIVSYQYGDPSIAFKSEIRKETDRRERRSSKA